MKSAFRTFSALALAICVVAAVFTVEAQKKPRRGDTGPTNPTPTQDIKSPAKNSQPKAIGSCDSIRGCNALKAACESKDVGGTFKPSKPDGSAGICDKKMSKGSPQGVSDFAAAGKDSHDATCFTQALCNALKKTCMGTYQQDNSNVPYGKCID
ncbi:MAG TPA: hypothetical protein VG324_30005 [Blastocatellia bacterium]|nr:hypothetical protein [Blastocatellia bacterium]